VTELSLKFPPGVIMSPGQFLQIETGVTFLRRPISVAGFDEGTCTVRIIVQDAGRGSHAISRLAPGDGIKAMGPLGNPFPMDEITDGLRDGRRIWLVGGGIGIAPLIFIADSVRSKGLVIDSFAGFRDEESVWGLRELEKCGNVTASIGGFVTDSLDRAMETALPDSVMACGPRPMLRALQAICAERGIPGKVSLEERMGCGIGACLVCSCGVWTDGGRDYRRVCRDGPVFDMAEAII
jgi:dihydroorotate dehydrogenase electron transfer subunit